MQVFRLLLCGIVLTIASLSAVAASYDDLKPLLIDIADWKAEASEGNSMDANGMKIIIATRNYVRSDNQNFNVQVGLMPGGTAAPAMANMNIENDDIKVTTSTIDDFQVYHNHEKAQNSGGVIVMLGAGNEKNSPLFILTYTGLNAQEAIDIAKKFDWKKMKATTETLLH